jgi:hypothetical protein
MKFVVATLAVTSLLVSTAFAATTPKPMSFDQSGSSLIDSATAEKIWQENTPANVAKLYPHRKFRFVSEVSGGFNGSKTCVVSARAMVLPVVFLPVQGTKIVYAPVKSATAFDAVPNLSNEQCQDLGKTKLKEAIQSLASALLSS